MLSRDQNFLTGDCGSAFICDLVVFDAVASSVYTTPIETVGRNSVDLKPLPKVERFQNDAVSSVM